MAHGVLFAVLLLQSARATSWGFRVAANAASVSEADADDYAAAAACSAGSHASTAQGGTGSSAAVSGAGTTLVSSSQQH